MSLNLRIGKSKEESSSAPTIAPPVALPVAPATSSTSVPAVAPANEIKSIQRRPTDFQRKGAMITSVERFRVITETLSSVSNILKDLKRNNYPIIKHRLENLKRQVAVEIRKEVPDFNPGNIIPTLPLQSNNKNKTQI